MKTVRIIHLLAFAAAFSSAFCYAAADARDGGAVQGIIEEFNDHVKDMEIEQKLFNEAIKVLGVEPEIESLTRGVDLYISGLHQVHLKVKDVLSRKDEVLAVIQKSTELLEKNLSEVDPDDLDVTLDRIADRRKTIQKNLRDLKAEYLAGHFKEEELNRTETLKSELESLEMEERFLTVSSKAAKAEAASYKNALSQLKKINLRSKNLFLHLDRVNSSMSHQIVRLEGVLNRLRPSVLLARDVKEFQTRADEALSMIQQFQPVQSEFTEVVKGMTALYGDLFSDEGFQLSKADDSKTVIQWLNANF